MAFCDLFSTPVFQAPMAGGVATPELVAAVSGAGGLGWLAAGYRSVADVQAQIDRVRELTDAPFGINVFVPGATGAVALVNAYRARLCAEAARFGVEPGTPLASDDGWDAKLGLLERAAVPVASFTFGCPPADVVARLHAVGTLVVVTVTSAAEAHAAAVAGADAVCAQGVEAGGHRGTFDNRDDDTALLPLLPQVRGEVDLPVIAAGGVSDGQGVAAALVAGAAAVQMGTYFLGCPESGAAAAYKAALRAAGRATRVTRAFTGRPARGLVNRFLTEQSPVAPAAYPELHYVTAPIRAAAAWAGDPEAMALWAGQGFALGSTAPAAQALADLWDEARTALRAAAARWA